MIMAKKIKRRARQDEDKQELREKILATARKEFANSSFESVSLQRIADSLGYSKATILRYFPTKVSLLVSVKERSMLDMIHRLERIASEKEDAHQRLRAVMNSYLEYWFRNPDHFKSLFSISGPSSQKRMPDGEYFGSSEIARRTFGIFVESLSFLLKEYEVDASQEIINLLATTLIAAAHGVISLPLGAPSFAWEDVIKNGRFLFESLIFSWEKRLEAISLSGGSRILTLKHLS